MTKITEIQLKEKLNQLIKKEIHEQLAKQTAKLSVGADELLVEMARINLQENGKSIFPYDKWEVRIWSNDYFPPHFHICSEGWDVSFLIETGEELNINDKGDKPQTYRYMCKNVKKWLQSPCVILPKLTNQENAAMQWAQLHG